MIWALVLVVCFFIAIAVDDRGEIRGGKICLRTLRDV